MIPDWIITGITSLQELAIWWTTGLLGALIYWIPVAILLVYYTRKNIADISADKAAVLSFKEQLESWEKDGKVGQKPQYYRNHTTLGTVLGRYVIVFIPVANLFLALFEALGDILDDITMWIRKLFNIEIIGVPDDK